MAVNGAIPVQLLAPLRTPGVADLLAARSFDDLLVFARTQGVVLTGTTMVQHAYRPYADQVRLFVDRYQTTYAEYAKGKVDRVYWDGRSSGYPAGYWWRKPGEAAAAVPGTSNHGLGLAVDFQGLGGFKGAKYKWMTENAQVFGWDNIEGKSVNEAWHWLYRAKNDHHVSPTPEPPDPPIPATPEDEPMTVIYKAQGTYGFIFDGWSFLQGDNGTLRALSAKEYGAFAQVNPQAVQRIAVWGAQDIYDLATRNGLWEFVGTQEGGDPEGLTGRLIGRDAPSDGSAPRSGSINRNFPRVEDVQ